ncbi:MAG: mandelate racemase/muconate lactonizing enzyme family protein [Acidimicrobiales bacterium]
MEIVAFESFVVGNPPPHKGGRYFIFVKLVTADGIVGYGEVYTATFSPDVVAAMIDDVCLRHVVGSDPHHIERLWRVTYSRGYSARPDLSLVSVLSGIEIACWDIIGKAAGKPVYELLGGRVHERIRTYTYLYPADSRVDIHAGTDVYAEPGVAAARAVEYIDRGFTGLKLDPMGGYSAFDPRQPSLERLDLAEAMVSSIREAIGNRADILFGTHGQFSASGAIRLAARLEQYDPLWFEEPTPPEMPEEMAKVAASTTIPVATGERLTTKYEFRRVLEQGAASILQPALGRVGGLLEGKKIAGMAEAHYAHIAPHLYCGPIEAAANITLAVCSPNFLILEAIEDWSGFHAELLVEPIQWEDGYVIPSSAPGIGVTLDEDVARANPYVGDLLHLEMHEQPLG